MSADVGRGTDREETAERGYVGQSVPRVEDYEILTGHAEYTDDLAADDCRTLALVRSMYAHASIDGVDATAAAAHPACEAVVTGEDVAAAYEPMPCPIDGFEEPALAVDRVRGVGEPVAMVVVDGDRYLAEDVADLVEVEYDVLDHVVDPLEAREDEVVLHPDVGSNVAGAKEYTFGDVDAAFEAADHVVEGAYSWGRISGVPLETAGVIARYDPEEDRFVLDSNIQLHTLTNADVCATLGYPEEKVEIRSPAHVGGSYGTKIEQVTRYCALAGMASKAVEAPVKYVEDRYEHLQGGDAHSTDREYRVRLAVDDDGTIRGVDVWFVDDFGAFPRYATNQAMKPLSIATGAYDVDAVRYSLEAVLTNKTSQSPYRGFGIQPHNYALEAVVDRAAREIGMDPTELRRRNLVGPDQMPYPTATRNVYDSGDYPAALARVEELVAEEREEGGLLDPDVVEQRRREGKYRGVRPCVLVEPGVIQSDWRDHWTAGDVDWRERSVEDAFELPEHVWAVVRDDGTIRVDLAADSSGQGHRTIVAQLLADELGLDPDEIEVDYRSSAGTPANYGAAASRLAVMVSGAVAGVAGELIEGLERLAADVWECDVGDVVYRDGAVERLYGVRSLTLAELAAADAERDGESTAASYAYSEPSLDHPEFEEAILRKLPSYTTTSYAADAVVVEVDVRTGAVELLTFYSVRDCGTQLNPMIVEGQEHGGVVQGIGAALMEEFTYDEVTGQPQSVTMFDYLLPSIDTVPNLAFEHTETPSPFTENGAKGVGETGITDAPAAIACSIQAALEPFDVDVDYLPFTPDRVRGKLREAGQ